jgi:hypothetical protein
MGTGKSIEQDVQEEAKERMVAGRKPCDKLSQGKSRDK